MYHLVVYGQRGNLCPLYSEHCIAYGALERGNLTSNTCICTYSYLHYSKEFPQPIQIRISHGLRRRSSTTKNRQRGVQVDKVKPIWHPGSQRNLLYAANRKAIYFKNFISPMWLVIQKTYGMVWTKVLLFNFNFFGVRRNMFCPIISFLGNLRVRFHSVLSSSLIDSKGVPQCSMIGTTLVSIIANDRYIFLLDLIIHSLQMTCLLSEEHKWVVHRTIGYDLGNNPH